MAIANNNVIGAGDKLAWQCKADFRFFRQITMNNIVIMGFNTFAGMGMRPLKNRTNIVVSREPIAFEKGDTYNCYSATSVTGALAIAKQLMSLTNMDAYVIGGKATAEAFKPYIDGALITRIQLEPEGDVFYDFPTEHFIQRTAYSLEPLDDNDPKCHVEVYERF
jgi:dihydrofolate reductase